MLTYSRMRMRICTSVILAGLAVTFLIPPLAGHAEGLRDEAVSYRTQGYEAQRRGDAASALNWYQKAAALDPSYPTPHNDLGVLLEEQGRMDEAERSYLQALSLNPNYLEAHANIAMLYERMGKKEQAVAHWAKRYQLGAPYDPWTARAEDRLVALGALKDSPELRRKIHSRSRLISQDFQANEKSIEEFHALSEQYADWP